MTPAQVYDTIQKAINEKKELTLAVRHGLGDLLPDQPFQGYVLGNDVYQYSFAWGYLTHTGLYYKFMLDSIASAKVTGSPYAVREDACYQYAIEEEHFARLEGFDNIYVQAAQHAGK